MYLTPLHRACAAGQARVVAQLIAAGADVDLQSDVTGSTPLFCAAQGGHDEVVQLLVWSQADVNLSRPSSGATPLYIAAQNGHRGVVKALIKAQSSVDLCRIDGDSPIHVAAQNNRLEIVELLAKAQADLGIQDATGCSALYIASQNGHNCIVDVLIEAKADTSLRKPTGASPLYIASMLGHSSIVASLLLSANADVNIPQSIGATPLLIASQNGHCQVMDLLIRALADVDSHTVSKITPIYVASQNGHSQAVDLLVRAQANVNCQVVGGCSPLYIASQNGHRKAAELLLKAEADIDMADTDGCTPLFAASQMGHQSVVDLLISAQAAVDHRELSQGGSVLYVAAQNGHRFVVASLVRALADVDIRDSEGCTPMYIAAENGHHQVVGLLIKSQADVNAQEVDGCTPLYIAAQNGHHRVVDALIQAQADVFMTQFEGATPLDIAIQNRHHRVVDSLVRAEAGFGATAEAAKSSSVDTCCATRITADDILSEQLTTALSASGFVQSRATLQSALADVLQRLLRANCEQIGYDRIFVVGSFSEGWGNSLTTLDGRTDIESDIDMMELLPGRIYHPRDLCRCRDIAREHQVEYHNGHIKCPGYASSPASAASGSASRQAVDLVVACLLCCYPPIGPLQLHRLSKSNIPQSVLKSLEQELSNSPCHVVHAAPPGQAGEQLRVSTTFLEKRLLRSLSSLQGQLFVTLKYLVKKVICRRVQGLKAYHAKTITFRMLEETPPDDWKKPENLVSLTRRSLHMLLESVEKSSQSDDGRIMEHFFLCDAGLYLKGADRSSTHKISGMLRDVIDELPQLLMEFKSSLRPVGNSGRFYFHPFQSLPQLSENPVQTLSLGREYEYFSIYHVVRESLVRLSDDDSSLKSREALEELIDRLPDCAKTARESLRALTCLKFGDRESALKILSDCAGHAVTRGIDWWPANSTSTIEAVVEDIVWQHLTSCDSAWKFCFVFEQRPTFRKFLPNLLAACFPAFTSVISHFFINFDALLQSLRFELSMPTSEVHSGVENSWILDVIQRDDADVQELLVSACYLKDAELLKGLYKRIVSAMSLVPQELQVELARRLKA